MSLTPEYYKETYFMLREVTIRAIASMPADQMHYHPPNSRSAGEIALHLANFDYIFTNPLTGLDDKPPVRLTMENYPTQEAILQVLKEGQKRTCDHLASLTPEDLARVMKTPMGTDGPAEVWLSVMLFHEADHKGNLVMISKSLGGNPRFDWVCRTA